MSPWHARAIALVVSACSMSSTGALIIGGYFNLTVDFGVAGQITVTGGGSNLFLARTPP